MQTFCTVHNVEKQKVKTFKAHSFCVGDKVLSKFSGFWYECVVGSVKENGCDVLFDQDTFYVDNRNLKAFI